MDKFIQNVEDKFNSDRVVYDSNWTTNAYFQLMERELKAEPFRKFLTEFLGPNTRKHDEVIQEIMGRFRSDPYYKNIDTYYNYQACLVMVKKSLDNVKALLQPTRHV